VIIGSILGVLAVVAMGIAIWFFVVREHSEQPSQLCEYETEVETRELAPETEGFDLTGDSDGETIGSAPEDYDVATVFGAEVEEGQL
jgi:hypothetical protein